MQIILIAAMAKNGVIGKNNQIPWSIKGEQKLFKKHTIGHSIIMGRKTYESIGKPLPDRRNIVITSNPEYSASNIQIANSIDAALAMCSNEEQVFIIGGANIYTQSIDKANKVYLTIIQREIDGDTYFPVISPTRFKIKSSEELELSEPAVFNIYERVKS